MLNHSCTPNTMQSFHGSRIVFRAVQHIPAGAEATIAYVELAATRAERSAALRANYFFDIDAGKVPPRQIFSSSMFENSELQMHAIF